MVCAACVKKGEGSKMEVVYEYLCTLVAVRTCWEQSAPFDRRMEADGSSIGSDLHGHPCSSVCVAVIGVHTCVSARSASTWVGIFDHRQSYRHPAKMIRLKKQINNSSVGLIWSQHQKWSGTQLTERLKQTRPFLHGFNAAISSFVLLGQAPSIAAAFS